MSARTEAEAKSKRCCGPNGCGERLPGMTSNARHERWCIASACMAWDWAANLGSEAWPAGTEIGYCGLTHPEASPK